MNTVNETPRSKLRGISPRLTSFVISLLRSKLRGIKPSLGLSSYGQLCGCPEILKKSCKFFCRGLDILVPQGMDFDAVDASKFCQLF